MRQMIMKKISLIFSMAFLFVSCAPSNAKSEPMNPVENSKEKEVKTNAKAYFASGCFWCVEAIFESINGVGEVISGYAGGTTQNPTYQLVSTGQTNHAEAVEIYYDSTIVSFGTLVDVFFNSHDPSTLNRQGPDAGTQYRSIAFYSNTREKSIIETKITDLKSKKAFSQITTQVQSIDVFYPAEDYHQDYEQLNPNNSYVRAVSIPRLNKFKAKMPEALK